MKHKDGIPRITQMCNWSPRIGLGVQRGSSQDFQATSLAPLQPMLGPKQNISLAGVGDGSSTPGQPG